MAKSKTYELAYKTDQRKTEKARFHAKYGLLLYSGMKISGEGGIRTLDTLLTYTHFPGVLFRPLRHLSLWFYQGLQRYNILAKKSGPFQVPAFYENFNSQKLNLYAVITNYIIECTNV